MVHGTKIKMTARQKKVMRLVDSGLYQKPNGKPNLTAIAKKLNVKSTHTLYADIEAIKAKQK